VHARRPTATSAPSPGADGLELVRREAIRADDGRKLVGVKPGMGTVRRVFAPRDPQEWQGRRMDITVSAPCSGSETCTGAKACVDGACTACAADSECGDGEACVLEHCVAADNVACRSRSECGGRLCILRGPAAGQRPYSELVSECLDPDSEDYYVKEPEGAQRARPGGPPATAVPPASKSYDGQRLLDSVQPTRDDRGDREE
jgi:hypothetical protein